MNDEFKSSNKTTWLIVLFLSSPVIVQCIKIAKEMVWPKYDQTQTTAMLEAALAELITHRKQQEMQEKQQVVYVPVSPQAMHCQNSYRIPHAGSSIDPRTMLLRMQQELKQQLERVAMLHAKPVTSQTNMSNVPSNKPSKNDYITRLPDVTPLDQVFVVKEKKGD